MPNFFSQPQIQPQPNPEPQGFDILRQWLMQRAGQQFANPYGMSPQGMQGLGGMPGAQGGGGQGDLFQMLMGLTRPAFDPYSQGMPQGPNSQPMGGGMRTQPGRTRSMPMRGRGGPTTQYDGQQDETQYDGVYWNQANTQARPPMQAPPQSPGVTVGHGSWENPNYDRAGQGGGMTSYGVPGMQPGPMPRPQFGGGQMGGYEPWQMNPPSGGQMPHMGMPPWMGGIHTLPMQPQGPMGGSGAFNMGAPPMRTLPMQQGGQAPPMTTQPVRPQQPMPNYRAMALPALMNRMGTRGNF